MSPKANALGDNTLLKASVQEDFCPPAGQGVIELLVVREQCPLDQFGAELLAFVLRQIPRHPIGYINCDLHFRFSDSEAAQSAAADLIPTSACPVGTFT